jgi:hypothetical protein
VNNNYLIPANSKKSMLILGLFNTTDLIIFISGCVATIILMLTNIQNNSLKAALFVLAPALVCSFLVIPLPNQHNVRTLIKNVYTYFTRRRTYIWKGWCMSFGKDETK